jgi:hypothetical protein
MKTEKSLLCLIGIAVLLTGCTHKGGGSRTNDAKGETKTLVEKPVYKIGDYYPDPDVTFSESGVVDSGIAPVGIVYQIDIANSNDGGMSGVTGYIVSLAEENTLHAAKDSAGVQIQKETKGIRWDDDNYYTAATNPHDGRDNMATIADFITANNKSWHNFNAFYWVITVMNGQTDYDAERDRWYLPSKNELKALYAGFSGKVYTEAWGDGYYMPGFNDQACVDARERFNAALVAAGGAPLDVSDYPYYWSSMEDYDSLAWIVNFRDGGYSLIDAKRYPIRVRAISAF